MAPLVEWLGQFIPLESQTIEKLLMTVFIVLFLLVVRWIVLRVVLRNFDDARVIYRWKKTATYITFTFIVLVAGALWIPTMDSLSTFLGLASAGIAIALKDPIVNFAGWGFILSRRPFEVGDRIQMGDFSGDVVDIRIFQFTILEIGNWVDADQSTGRIIHIPNGKIFTGELASFNKGFNFIWIEIPVLVTFESNWEKAKEILADIANKHGSSQTSVAKRSVKEASKKFMIYYRNLTPIVYTSVKDSGIMLTIRSLSNPRRRRNLEEKFWEAILTEFAKHSDIDLAYPTQRLFNNRIEGKPGHNPDVS